MHLFWLTVTLLMAPAQAGHDDLLAVIEIPRAAHDLRQVGISAVDVRIVLQHAHHLHVPHSDVYLILHDGHRHAKKHGPVDNFGAFVQGELDRGLRGRDLAESIHHHHKHRGPASDGISIHIGGGPAHPGLGHGGGVHHGDRGHGKHGHRGKKGKGR